MGEGEERVWDRDGSAGHDGVDYLSSIGTAWQVSWHTVIDFCAHAGPRAPSFGVDTSQTKTPDPFNLFVTIDQGHPPRATTHDRTSKQELWN